MSTQSPRSKPEIGAGIESREGIEQSWPDVFFDSQNKSSDFHQGSTIFYLCAITTKREFFFCHF